MSIDVEKFEKLQNKLKKIEPKLAEIEGIRKEKRKQTKEIYTKWGVENLAELKTLKEEKEQAAEKVMIELQEYVDDMTEQLEQLDEAIL